MEKKFLPLKTSTSIQPNTQQTTPSTPTSIPSNPIPTTLTTNEEIAKSPTAPTISEQPSPSLTPILPTNSTPPINSTHLPLKPATTPQPSHPPVKASVKQTVIPRQTNTKTTRNVAPSKLHTSKGSTIHSPSSTGTGTPNGSSPLGVNPLTPTYSIYYPFQQQQHKPGTIVQGQSIQQPTYLIASPTSGGQPITTAMMLSPSKTPLNMNLNAVNVNVMPMSNNVNGVGMIYSPSSPINKMSNTMSSSSTAAVEGKDHSATSNVVTVSSLGERVKPTIVPVSVLHIGNWIRRSNFLGDIFCKFYYRKKQIVWEMMSEPFGYLRKIVIYFSDIAKIDFITTSEKTTSMTVEVIKSPTFYHEVNPQPGRGVQWIATQDFTGGQASISSKHTAYFSKSILSRHIGRLVNDETIKKLIVSKNLPAIQATSMMEDEEEDDNDEEETEEYITTDSLLPHQLAAFYPHQVIIPQYSQIPQQYLQYSQVAQQTPAPQYSVVTQKVEEGTES